MTLPDDLIKLFSDYQKGLVKRSELSLKLEQIASSLINHEVPVVIGDFDYPDIFNNINVVFKGNKLVLENRGIWIDTEILNKFTPEELAAAFLFEVGVYEQVLLQPNMKYWLLISASITVLAPLYAIYSTLIKLSRKFTKLQAIDLIKAYVLSMIIGTVVYFIGHVKHIDLSGKALVYVRKYRLQKSFVSFIKKHKRPFHLYLYGAEKYIPLNEALNSLLARIKELINLIMTGSKDESTSIICQLYKQEYKTLKEYGMDDLEFVKEMVTELRSTCYGPVDMLLHPKETFKKHYELLELEKELSEKLGA